MNFRTIGYVLDNIEINNFAFCYKGDCEGVTLFADQNDENRLKLLYPDGYISSKHFFKKDPTISFEESKQWLLFHEIDDEKIKSEVSEKVAKSFVESVKSGTKFDLK